MTADQIRDYLASEIFWPDIDGDVTSDSAWHHWLEATRYNQEQRKKWLDEHSSTIPNVQRK